MADRPLDRLVSFLFRESGDELRLATGTKVMLRSAAGERAVLANPMRSAQIEALLRDVVPPGKGSDVTIPYESSHGEVMISVKREGGGVQVSVRRKAPEASGRAVPLRTGTGASASRDEKPRSAAMDDLMRAFVGAEPAQRPGPPAPTAPMAVSAVAAVPLPSEPPKVSGIQMPPSAFAPAVAAPVAPAVVGAPAPAPRAPITLESADDSSFEIDLKLGGADSIPAPVGRPPGPVPLTRAAGVSNPAPMDSSFTPRFEPVAPGAKARIDEILQALVQAKASDLHLTSGLKPKMRLDGEIVDIPGYPMASSDLIEAWLMEIASVSTQQKFYETHDADYAYEIEGLSRFRVNAFRDRRGVGGVLRVIPSKILSFEQLNLPPACLSFCQLSKGLVVVTGPTGSGKSTTLAAMVDWINTNRRDHLITIEDPVEFVHHPKSCLINQREVHTHTKSFSSALRAALREDPDIVLVGEMRDLETVSIAIETAETGHLVFGTLHTNTAISTVDRIIDQFPTDQQSQVRVMLSESLKGVVAQTLCKKRGGGRVAALEILVVVAAVANLIREGKTFQIASIMQTGKNQGQQLLNDAFMSLVKDGKIEAREAYAKAVQKAELKAMLERAGYGLD